MNHLQDDWSDWLSLAEFQFNDHIHTATKEMPFYLNYGRHPWKGDISLEKVNTAAVNTYLDQLQEARAKAKEAIAQLIMNMKTAYDKGLRKKKIKINDRVWLEATNIRSDRPSKKLSEKRYRPFKVLEVIREASFRLELLNLWKLIHPVFHRSLLTPYYKSKFPSQHRAVPPQLEIIRDELEYEVQSILDSR
ncbi:MAG TPA: hypothetical protein VEP90_22315 [Methylomirabilota bacterium]|nr:hypothetical protein [Methylomirabilota bacterium]